jgi:hypothetical protein
LRGLSGAAPVALPPPITCLKRLEARISDKNIFTTYNLRVIYYPFETAYSNT